MLAVLLLGATVDLGGGGELLQAEVLADLSVDLLRCLPGLRPRLSLSAGRVGRGSAAGYSCCRG